MSLFDLWLRGVLWWCRRHDASVVILQWKISRKFRILTFLFNPALWLRMTNISEKQLDKLYKRVLRKIMRQLSKPLLHYIDYDSFLMPLRGDGKEQMLENDIRDLKAQDSHRCEYCDKCGLEQRTYWGVTPALWEQVVPEHFRHSVLCWECFLRYADIKDISFTSDDILIFGFVGTFENSKAIFPKLIDRT